MERQYVSSSNIASIGYDPDNQVLEIEFLSGAVYQYYVSDCSTTSCVFDFLLRCTPL